MGGVDMQLQLGRHDCGCVRVAGVAGQVPPLH